MHYSLLCIVLLLFLSALFVFYSAPLLSAFYQLYFILFLKKSVLPAFYQLYFVFFFICFIASICPFVLFYSALIRKAHWPESTTVYLYIYIKSLLLFWTESQVTVYTALTFLQLVSYIIQWHFLILWRKKFNWLILHFSHKHINYVKVIL